MQQLSLFDEQTRAQLDAARAEIAWLRTRLDTAVVEYRKLRDQQTPAPCPQCQDLRRRLTQAEGERDEERSMAALWRRLYTLHRQERPLGERVSTSRDDLTTLLKLAHPDRWSQGQPAVELAHEISVVVNQLRGRLGAAS
jgi:predicted  nucleic acid-binding Zn-ribbon protein